jgi:hypothetical protein
MLIVYLINNYKITLSGRERNAKKTDKKHKPMKYKFFNYKTFSWKKYVFETLSIFIAVVSAFALNNWNLNRRDRVAKKSCAVFRDLVENKIVNQDSIQEYYYHIFSDFIFTSNKTGYEGLTAKGLDIVKDKLLRKRIAYYYNYYFDILTKIEEQNEQAQAYKNYFFPINNMLAQYMQFNEQGELIEITQPIHLSEIDKNKLYSYLWQLETNRKAKIDLYTMLEEQLKVVQEHVQTTLDKMD